MSPPDYGVTSRIILYVFQPPPGQRVAAIPYNKIPWCAIIILDVPSIDLAGCMKRGLFWTTENIVGPAEGQLWSLQDVLLGYDEDKLIWTTDQVRSWRLREFPSRLADESRWTGRIVLFAHLSETLSNFRLDQLARHHIQTALVFSAFGRTVFEFDVFCPNRNKNDLSDKSPTDLWWLWPMESIVPEETLESELPCRDLIGSGHVEKACPVDHRSGSGQEATLLLLGVVVVIILLGGMVKVLIPE